MSRHCSLQQKRILHVMDGSLGQASHISTENLLEDIPKFHKIAPGRIHMYARCTMGALGSS
eukprot:7692032-Karenia_brevis.AAC.1